MITGLIAIASFIAGAACCLICNALFRRRAERKHIAERVKAKAVLAKYGLRAEIIFPAIGVADVGLSTAIDVLAPPSCVILNNEGDIIGRFGKTYRRAPTLKLVVNNDRMPE